MDRRALKILTILSFALLMATVLLFISGYALSSWDHHVSFGDSCHIGVWNRGLDSRLVVFSDSDYGPYRGSIIGLVDANGNVYPPLKRRAAYGDAWGIYYRYFQWADAKLWTLMVSLWYPIAILAIMPLVRFVCASFRGKTTAT